MRRMWEESLRVHYDGRGWLERLGRGMGEEMPSCFPPPPLVGWGTGTLSCGAASGCRCAKVLEKMMVLMMTVLEEVGRQEQEREMTLVQTWRELK